MQFVTEKSSHSVARFYDLFQHKLPVIVKVTQGFYGDIIEDTFDREEIMILCAVSRQSRVVGNFSIGSESKLMSIPEEYTEKLCIVNRGKVSKEDHLYNIIRNNSLPAWVRFPTDRVLTVGNRTMSTNDIPPIELAKRFDEVHLLGNTLTNGELNEEVIRVPLYLSELRLSLVTGILGQSFERWRILLDRLKRKCSGIEYDIVFGNPNIAEYDPKAIHSDTKISYVQPKSYSSIIGVVQGQPLKHRPNLQVPKREKYGGQYLRGGKNIQSRPLPPLPGEQKQSSHNIVEAASDSNSKNFSESMYITPIAPSKSDQAGKEVIAKPRRASPVPDYDQGELSALEARPSAKEKGQIATRQKPAIPERQPISVHHNVTKQHDMKNPKYANNVPRTFIAPTIQTQYSQEKLITTQSASVSRSYGNNSKTKKIVNVEELSIHEVCEYLKMLKLDQYSEKFRDNMIDGAMLVNLTGTILREDLGMKGIEALRLIKFVKEGYIPA